MKALKDENTLMYERGFGRAVDQLQIVHPNLDVSYLDPLKIVEDRAIVD